MGGDYQRGWWSRLQREVYSIKRDPWMQRISTEPYGGLDVGNKEQGHPVRALCPKQMFMPTTIPIINLYHKHKRMKY